MSSTNNNSQIPSNFGTTQAAGQNPTSDQFMKDHFPGGTGTNFDGVAPSGTHAQQHNLHGLETPLNPPTSGDDRDLEQKARKLQSDLENSHPHTQQHNVRPDQYSQNQGHNHAGNPLSAQAAHDNHGSALPSGMGTGVGGANPYATASMGATGSQGFPTTLPGTGMSIGGQQGSNLPVHGSGHPTNAGTHGTTGFTNTANTGTHGTTGLHNSHDHSRTGPLETTGVLGSTGHHTTPHHGTTHTGTHGHDNSDRFQTTGGHSTSEEYTGHTHHNPDGTHGTGLEPSRHQDARTHTTSEGRKDGALGHDVTSRATTTGKAAHKVDPTSEPIGHKPTMGDKIAGMADKVQGKITGNPVLVAKGESRGQGLEPKN